MKSCFLYLPADVSQLPIIRQSPMNTMTEHRGRDFKLFDHAGERYLICVGFPSNNELCNLFVHSRIVWSPSFNTEAKKKMGRMSYSRVMRIRCLTTTENFV